MAICIVYIIVKLRYTKHCRAVIYIYNGSKVLFAYVCIVCQSHGMEEHT